MEHTLPPIACISPKHSGHTGKREMFSRGKPQMRQSEGNKTENTPSEARRIHLWARVEGACPETIERLSPATVAWPARIRSSLLLKTASSCLRGQAAGRSPPYFTPAV